MFAKLAVAVALASTTLALPIRHTRREVPQEHSHEKFLTAVRTSLNLNNPNQIQDPVFGLLGAAAAAKGAGLIADPDCLQQATADQAFTNAKAAGDVDGQVNALIFRTLERNTGQVGLKSVPCVSIKAVNPEIAALQQHQDPASDGAADLNKQITLALAQQIALVGGDPLLALQSGTFAPGQIGDPTAKGNTCDVADDPVGCIFTQNLLVEDALDAEIQAAVANIVPAANSAVNSVNAFSAIPSFNSFGNLNVFDINAFNIAAAAAAAQQLATANALAAAALAIPPVVNIAPAVQIAPASVQAAPAAAQVSASNGVNVVNVGANAFGTCSNPSVQFGAGLDGRKATEFSFIPVDLVQFNHGSALNPAIIFQFVCDNLVNQCGLTNQDQIVIDCRAAQDQALTNGRTGKTADVFNGLLGFQTNFAALDAQVAAA